MKYLLILLTSFNLWASSLEERINYIYQEEKLAYETYTELNSIYNLNVFSNIAKSELTHMESVATLAKDLNIDLYPVSYGEFTFEELRDLKNELIEIGNKDIISAIGVGIKVEEVDIKDLENLLIDSNSREKITYTNLLKGSENHLTAFKKNLARY